MTEHVQLEIIAAFILIAGQIITIWRADIAARRAEAANLAAVQANHAAVQATVAAVKASDEGIQGRAKQTAIIHEVKEAVNGGMAAAKTEIVDLKAEVKRLNIIIAENVVPSNSGTIKPLAAAPEHRLEQLRGQQ